MPFTTFTCLDCGCETTQQFKCMACWSFDRTVPKDVNGADVFCYFPPPAGFVPRKPMRIPIGAIQFAQGAALTPRRGYVLKNISYTEYRARLCLQCGRELCEALDAYYGDNAYLKSLCASCQRRAG